jgi:hypothetical protein
MFLTHPKFFDEERQSPIMDRNNDYITPDNIETLVNRTSSWKDILSQSNVSGFKVQDIGPTPSERIIKHDAERTFLNPERRKTLARILSCFENHFHDYHQGLSLTCGFLLLTLKEQEVANIISLLASNPKYIPNYWRSEAVAGARDAYVWEFLLQNHYPDIAAHLKQRRVVPETFCQKWFIALTINVLPFKSLFLFFEHFLSQGYIYLFKFGISLVSTYKEEILSGVDYQIFQVLRLDKELCKTKENFSDDHICDFVERAAHMELISFDIHTVRATMEKQILARITEAENRRKEDAHNNEASGSSEDSEEGTCCDLCENNVPDYWCKNCKKMICEMCHSKNVSPHTKKHKVDCYWE